MAGRREGQERKKKKGGDEGPGKGRAKKGDSTRDDVMTELSCQYRDNSASIVTIVQAL